jgi:hypothetical protein
MNDGAHIQSAQTVQPYFKSYGIEIQYIVGDFCVLCLHRWNLVDE